MKLDDLKKVIKEVVKEAIREDLHQIMETVLKSSITTVLESISKNNSNNIVESKPTTPVITQDKKPIIPIKKINGKTANKIPSNYLEQILLEEGPTEQIQKEQEVENDDFQEMFKAALEINKRINL